MASQNIGTLFADVEVRLQKLDAGLARAEAKVKASAGRMKQSANIDLDQQFSKFTSSMGKLAVVASVAESGIHGLNAAIALIKGNTAEAEDALDQFGESLDNNMVTGPAYKFGRFIRKHVLGKDEAKELEGIKKADEAAKAAITEQTKRVEANIREREKLADLRGQNMADEAGRGGNIFPQQRVEAGETMRKSLADLDKRAGAGGADASLFAGQRQQIEKAYDLRLEAIAAAESEERRKRKEAEAKKAADAREAAEREAKQAEELARDKAKRLFDVQTDVQASELRLGNKFREAQRLEIQRDTQARILEAEQAGDLPLAAAERKRGNLALREFDSKRTTEGFSATQLALNLPGLGRQPDVSTAKGQQEQTGVLRDMLAAITRMSQKAVAA